MEMQSDFLHHAQQVHELRSHSLSETDTRVYLIDPVLRMLGYGSFSDLRREVPIPASKEFIDYQLLIDGHPKAIVEAKALRHAITDQDAAQCVQYASILGAPWCLITNGARWHLYYAYGTGALAEKKVAEVRLDGDEGHLAEAWRVLSLVSKTSLGQANPLTKLLVERVVRDELSRPDSGYVAGSPPSPPRHPRW
jgi:predicted type IV restriction endonuclease